MHGILIDVALSTLNSVLNRCAPPYRSLATLLALVRSRAPAAGRCPHVIPRLVLALGLLRTWYDLLPASVPRNLYARACVSLTNEDVSLGCELEDCSTTCPSRGALFCDCTPRIRVRLKSCLWWYPLGRAPRPTGELQWPRSAGHGTHPSCMLEIHVRVQCDA